MASVTYDKPRHLAVPAPYSSGTGKPVSGTKAPDTIRALREKLGEFKNENTLLGSLVKDLKVERDNLSKKFTAASKQLADANSRAANASAEHQAASKEQRRLQAEVQRLSSIVHSHSLCLQKSKQRQQELEDVALDLQQKLVDANTQLADAQQAEQEAQQRSTAAEAKLAAAGLGAMPKMGPTAEQLVINSMQRIRELTEELAAAKAAVEQQKAALQQQHRQQEQHWQQQIAAAEQQLQQSQHAAEQRQKQQELELQRQAGRLSESEQQVQQLQHMLVGLQADAAEGCALAEAKAELQRLKHDMLSQTQSLQQQVLQLQTQLADAQLQHASTMSDQQQQVAQLERKVSTAHSEKQQLVAALIAVRQQESSHRIAVSEVTAKLERLRGQTMNCVGELQVQMDGAAAASQQHTEVLHQLRAAEATAAAARAEAAETRQQLVELASLSIAELRVQVAGEYVAITGLPHDTVQALPTPVTAYIKVLEHAICDCEQRCKQLLADTLAAQQQERKLQADLSSAREHQAAAQRALTQQTQRLLAAERMRLSDLREIQGVEKRLLLAQQECWTLRDALLAAKSGTAAAAAITVANADAGCAVAATDHGQLIARCAAADIEGSGANLGGDHGGAQQLQLPCCNQQQEPTPRLWAVAAADAAAAHGSTAAAATAAAIHQTKLQQLRQLKQQLSNKSKGFGPATSTGLQPQQHGDGLPGSCAGGCASHPGGSSESAGLPSRVQHQQQDAEQHVNSSTAAVAPAVEHQQSSRGASQAASFKQKVSLAAAGSFKPGSGGRTFGQEPTAVAQRNSSPANQGQSVTSGGRGVVLKQISSKLTASRDSSNGRPCSSSSAGCGTLGLQNEILSPKELEVEQSSRFDHVRNSSGPADGAGHDSRNTAPSSVLQLSGVQLHSAEVGSGGSSVEQPVTTAWLQPKRQLQPQWQHHPHQPSLGGQMKRLGPGGPTPHDVHCHGGRAAQDWRQLQAEVMGLCPEPFDAGMWQP